MILPQREEGLSNAEPCPAVPWCGPGTENGLRKQLLGGEWLQSASQWVWRNVLCPNASLLTTREGWDDATPG